VALLKLESRTADLTFADPAVRRFPESGTFRQSIFKLVDFCDAAVHRICGIEGAIAADLAHRGYG
jgi:hypothetical protein